MSDEKNLLDGLHEIWHGMDTIWVWLSSLGAVSAVLFFIFREIVIGALDKVGEFIATKILAKKKVQHLKERAARADERGRLHNFLAEELYKVNKRLDMCEERHKERDRRDAELEKKLSDCHTRREELEIKNVRLISDARAASIENAKLVAENSKLRGRHAAGG